MAQVESTGRILRELQCLLFGSRRSGKFGAARVDVKRNDEKIKVSVSARLEERKKVLKNWDNNNIGDITGDPAANYPR